MGQSLPITYLRTQHPALAERAGPRGFIGWMHRKAFPNAPPAPDARSGCMVLYAPTERFPEAVTLAEMRAGKNRTTRATQIADDMIVKGAREDGVKLDRKKFDAKAWAVIPDFLWEKVEQESIKEVRH